MTIRCVTVHDVHETTMWRRRAAKNNTRIIKSFAKTVRQCFIHHIDNTFQYSTTRSNISNKINTCGIIYRRRRHGNARARARSRNVCVWRRRRRRFGTKTVKNFRIQWRTEKETRWNVSDLFFFFNFSTPLKRNNGREKKHVVGILLSCGALRTDDGRHSDERNMRNFIVGRTRRGDERPPETGRRTKRILQ